MKWSYENIKTNRTNSSNNKGAFVSLLNNKKWKINRYTSTGIVSISGLAILLLALFVLPLLSASKPTHAATPIEPTISIIPASGITMDMTPAGGTAGSFGTATASVTVNSTNVSGYTLTMNTETTDPDLKNSKIDYTDPTKADLKITNLTASTTESNFSPNKWGYNVSKSGTYLKGANGTYVPVPNSGSSTADKQIDATTAAGNGTYTFTYGVKANNNLPAGAYNNTLVFSATGNALPKYSLTINFAGSGVSSVKVCLVSGNCSGSNLVGTVSSSGGSVANLTYSDAYYLYPTFSTNYELDNWAKTSGEGTLSSTSATNPTFTIDLGNGTVTITGKEKPKLYMWNATSADCGTTMWDNRDGTERSYTTATIGNLCWMTKNLMLGKSTTTALTSSTSNVRSSGYTLPASSTSGFSSNTAQNVYVAGDRSCSSSQSCYAYYTYAAATAGTNPSSGASNYDICPAGWRLPTQAEFYTLKGTYTTGATLTASPWLGVYSGYYYSSQFYRGGSYGYYWSSTADSSSSAYYLAFSSSGAAVDYLNKYSGRAVRCVAKS